MKPTRDPSGTPTEPRFGRRGEVLVAIQGLVAAAFILAPGWNGWVGQEALARTANARDAMSWLLAITAAATAISGLVQIWRYLTPLPYPVAHNELVTTGIYGAVRHPLYSCQLMAALAWTLHTCSATHMAVLAIGFAFFDYKASIEERWLRERHPSYADYARRVRKLVPWLY